MTALHWLVYYSNSLTVNIMTVQHFLHLRNTAGCLARWHFYISRGQCDFHNYVRRWKREKYLWHGQAWQEGSLTTARGRCRRSLCSSSPPQAGWRQHAGYWRWCGAQGKNTSAELSGRWSTSSVGSVCRPSLPEKWSTKPFSSKRLAGHFIQEQWP